MAQSQAYQDWLADRNNPQAARVLFDQAHRLALQAAAPFLHGEEIRGEDEEDVAAHAVAKLFSEQPPVTSDRAWVVRVACNESLDLIRWKRTHGGQHDSINPADEGGADPAFIVDIGDDQLARLHSVHACLNDAIRSYIIEGAEPQAPNVRQRVGLWLFAWADPTRVAQGSLEILATLLPLVTVSQSALWRARRPARAAWSWVCQEAARRWPKNEDDTLFRMYCDEVKKQLESGGTDDE